MSTQVTKPALVSSNAPANTNNPRDNLKNKFKEYESKELVVALSGPLGCGIDVAKAKLEIILHRAQYKIHHIKISDWISDGLSNSE